MKFGYVLFYVDNVAKTMKFYERAFGLKKGFFHESGQYGEMISGETKLGFVHHDTAGSHGFEYERMNISKKPPAFEIAFTTIDVETSFKTALKEGAKSICEPTQKPWGQTVSYVQDCNGFLVEICSPINGL